MSDTHRIIVNTRVLRPPTTGVQRYTLELLSRFQSEVDCIRPAGTGEGQLGHLWEQIVLPTRLNGALLWSPSNTGPLLVGNQVVTVHDVVPLDHPEWLSRQFSSFYRFVVPRLVRRVRAVIAISEFTKGRILENVDIEANKIFVIPNGVDARFSPRPDLEVDSVVQQLRIPSRRYVLAVGSLEPRKNLPRLLNAWNRIHELVPDDVWLVLAGAKGKRMVYRDVDLRELPPRVHLTGHVPDNVLPALYSGALVFAYPSIYEGFGLPPLEAMASGVAVLTGNTSALPEVVGDAAITVDPFSVDAIAEGLLQLVNDGALRSQLQSKGITRAKKFTWENTAKETLMLLRGAAS